jgi:copper chaperone CopZ
LEVAMIQITKIKQNVLSAILIAVFSIFALTITASANDKNESTPCKCKISAEVNSFYDKDLVETELKNHDGVKEVYLDLDEKIVYVTYDTKKTSTEKLCKIINDLGYETKVVEEKKNV